MKIAASSCCWWHDSLELAVEKAAAAGFTAFEPLTFSPELLDLHGDLRKLSAADLQHILGNQGLTLAALHLGAIPTATEERRRLLTDYAKRAIEVAAETGCRLIVEGGPDRASEPLQPFYQSLEELVPFAASMGVRIALENHYRNWIQFLQDYEHIFARIDHPSLGITLDTGHFIPAPASIPRWWRGGFRGGFFMFTSRTIAARSQSPWARARQTIVARSPRLRKPVTPAISARSSK